MALLPPMRLCAQKPGGAAQGQQPVGIAGAAAGTTAPAAKPVIRQFTPAQGAQGTSLTLTISGANFTPGLQVAFNPASGITVQGTSFVSSNQLQAQISIDRSAPLGPRQLSITTMATLAAALSVPARQSFTVVPGAAPAPNQDPANAPPPQQPATGAPPATDAALAGKPAVQIREFTPPQGAQGTTLTVQIAGANFAKGMQVAFNPPAGIKVLSTNVVSSFQLQAQISIDPAAPLGPRKLGISLATALAGGVGVTARQPFTVVPGAGTPQAGGPPAGRDKGPGPLVVRLIPNQLPVGARNVTLVIRGENFAPNATVSFSPADVRVTPPVLFINSSELHVTVDVFSTITGPRDVIVTNARGGSGTGRDLLLVQGLEAGPGRGYSGAKIISLPVAAISLKPQASIKLAGPVDKQELWNFYGTHARYAFKWSDSASTKPQIYTVSIGKDGEAPVLKIQVGARDFLSDPLLLTPAQVFKLKHGESYTWQVDGYDGKGKWISRTIQPWHFKADVYFTDNLNCEPSSCDEATIVPEPDYTGTDKNTATLLANRAIKFTVTYGQKLKDAMKSAQGDALPGEEQRGGGMSPGSVTQATSIQAPVADSLVQHSVNYLGQSVIALGVQIRDPFGQRQENEFCMHWTSVDWGDGTPPEMMDMCHGWAWPSDQVLYKDHQFPSVGTFTVKVYTEGGGFYHLMACIKVDIQPPPCHVTDPITLAKKDPFKLTGYQGTADAQPTVSTYWKTTPRPVAQIGYTGGKGSVGIEWSVDGSLIETQTVDLAGCEGMKAITLDRDLPHKSTDLPPAGKGLHTVSARVVSVAGSAAPKEDVAQSINAISKMQLLGGLGGGNPPPAQQPLSKFLVATSFLQLMAPAEISPVDSPVNLKYNVDDAPPPPDMPVEIDIATAKSGKFVIVDLSKSTKITAGKVSGGGVIQLPVTDAIVNVATTFSDLTVSYDPSTHIATVTGGAIDTPLSNTFFNVGNFQGELDKLKIDMTAATVSGKVTLPAATGLTVGGSTTSIPFSDAEFFLEWTGDSPTFGHFYKEGITLPDSNIFSTGFRLLSPAVTVDFSKLKGSGVGTECGGSVASASSFLGVVLGKGTKIAPPSSIFGDALANSYSIPLDDTAVISSGFSRQLKNIPINQSASLFSFTASLDTGELDWCGSSFAFTVNSTLKNLPLFSNNLSVKATITQDGGLTASSSGGTVGPVSIGPLTLTGKNFGFEFTGGQGVRVKLDLDAKVDLPSTNLGNLPFQDVRIGPHGEFSIGSGSVEGWKSLGSSASAEFYGFGLSLSELGAGVEAKGGSKFRAFLGVSGALTLTDIIPIHGKASADRIRFYMAENNGVFSFDGVQVDKIAVDFTYADLGFKGSIGWKGNPLSAELMPGPLDGPGSGPVLAGWRSAGGFEDPDSGDPLWASLNPAPGALPSPMVPPMDDKSSRFFGELGVSLMDLGDLNAGFLVGNSSGSTFFLARLTADLPSPGIMLGSTPLSLQSIAGGIGYHVAWGKLGSTVSFSNPCDATNVNDFDAPLESVAYDSGRSFTLKAGVGIGTATDDGDLLYMRGVFSLDLPGPNVGVDIGAWLLGADRGGNPEACGHVGYYNETFTASVGVDLKFKDLVEVSGAAELQFGKLGYHIYVGTQQNPVQAKFVGVGGASGFLDVDSSGIKAGGGVHVMVGKQKSGGCWDVYGYAGSTVTCGMGIYLNPPSIDASYSFSVSGGMGITIFCVDIGVDATGTLTISGKLPPPQICGNLSLSGEVCFVFCKSASVDLSVCFPP